MPRASTSPLVQRVLGGQGDVAGGRRTGNECVGGMAAVASAGPPVGGRGGRPRGPGEARAQAEADVQAAEARAARARDAHRGAGGDGGRQPAGGAQAGGARPARPRALRPFRFRRGQGRGRGLGVPGGQRAPQGGERGAVEGQRRRVGQHLRARRTPSAPAALITKIDGEEYAGDGGRGDSGENAGDGDEYAGDSGDGGLGDSERGSDEFAGNGDGVRGGGGCGEHSGDCGRGASGEYAGDGGLVDGVGGDKYAGDSELGDAGLAGDAGNGGHGCGERGEHGDNNSCDDSGVNLAVMIVILVVTKLCGGGGDRNVSDEGSGDASDDGVCGDAGGGTVPGAISGGDDRHTGGGGFNGFGDDDCTVEKRIRKWGREEILEDEVPEQTRTGDGHLEVHFLERSYASIVHVLQQMTEMQLNERIQQGLMANSCSGECTVMNEMRTFRGRDTRT
ncbi:Protein of unknown function [Gryllus bimaculatus]|nr:Protein of unknown function [Gryllus bimaculatus]